MLVLAQQKISKFRRKSYIFNKMLLKIIWWFIGLDLSLLRFRFLFLNGRLLILGVMFFLSGWSNCFAINGLWQDRFSYLSGNLIFSYELWWYFFSFFFILIFLIIFIVIIFIIVIGILWTFFCLLLQQTLFSLTFSVGSLTLYYLEVGYKSSASSNSNWPNHD